ncbi:hypothetical protein MMC21_001932 [Puttea exsequens]|nr:hypothetical protein [Puttea exsequens]
MEGQSLDVVVSGHTEQYVDRELPHGMKALIALGRRPVRITYNLSIVGARGLLSAMLDGTVALAPPHASAELESGSRHLRKEEFLSTLSTLLTIPVLILAWVPLPQLKTIYNAISLVLATSVHVFIAGTFYPSSL